MFHGTTILTIRDKASVVVAGDGQVSMGNTIVKDTAKKVRRLADNKVVVGFAGSTADAMTLFERLEGKLKEYNKNLLRSCVEMAKDWRTDRYLRKLEAMLIAADKDHTLVISGTGDVIEPDEGIAAIGSGGPFALAAAKALSRHTSMTAREMAEKALLIASEICVFTNQVIAIEEIDLTSG